MRLPRPYNLLMPLRGHSLEVEIYSHAEGHIPTIGAEGEEPTNVSTVRLYTKRVDRESPAVWVDVTCRQPQAMLEGFLRTGALVGKTVEFRAAGRGPTRRDTIHIKPRSGR